jgi:hypothetical protein
MEEMREIVGNNLRGPAWMEEMQEIVGNNLPCAAEPLSFSEVP